MEATALYRQGNLDGALEASIQEIKGAPTHIGKRAFLAELLCMQGNYERADVQLEALLALEPRSLITIGTWRQLLRAATSRIGVFSKGALPDLIEPPSRHVRALLELLLTVRQGDQYGAAAAIVEQLETQRQRSPCLVNGKPVADLRDLDDRFAGIVEMFGSNGKYFWVEQPMIVSIVFDAPERPIDLFWRRAEIVLKSGTVGQVFIPTVYPSATECGEARLGRRTDWHEQDGVAIGIGQRMLLVDDAAVALSDLESIEFQQP